MLFEGLLGAVLATGGFVLVLFALLAADKT
jgi:hypothetical protein